MLYVEVALNDLQREFQEARSIPRQQLRRTPEPRYPQRAFHRHNLAEAAGRAVLPCCHACQSIPQLRICGTGSNRRRTQEKGKPKDAGDLAAGSSRAAGSPTSMWRSVSFLAAQAALASCSEARMSTIRDVLMVRNTGCQNSRCIPRPINRSFSIEPPHVDPAILTGTGSGQYFGWPEIRSRPRPPITMVYA